MPQSVIGPLAVTSEKVDSGVGACSRHWKINGLARCFLHDGPHQDSQPGCGGLDWPRTHGVLEVASITSDEWQGTVAQPGVKERLMQFAPICSQSFVAVCCYY